ncbi:MAG: LacI family transcriptional regulator [Puniceicoccaceae bacterium]|nr:MAG: LacI family transcriptional regulator [Puniceicoccaceae bacterium]
MSGPSLRELARSLGLSHTTVSEALRDCPRVHPKTRERVVKAAEKAGYRYNPLAGALMSEMRRSRAGTFRGLLAILDVDDPADRTSPANRFHQELTAGATERATELGFKAETFAIAKQNLSLKRLDTILQSRSIRGIFLLPVTVDPDLSGLDWSHYAGIYSDYHIQHPALHTVCSNHYRSMLLVMEKLHRLGYRRPGLVINRPHDERLLYRWEASFLAYQTHRSVTDPVPPLVEEDATRESFGRWFRKTKPDVVLCHNTEVLEWMKAEGAEIPSTHGFCCLNTLSASVPCAGLDLRPRLIGARGIELLIAQIHRNEYGPPEVPNNTTLIAAWQPGPTLRGQAG